jgi:hypothetical protein
MRQTPSAAQRAPRHAAEERRPSGAQRSRAAAARPAEQRARRTTDASRESGRAGAGRHRPSPRARRARRRRSSRRRHSRSTAPSGSRPAPPMINSRHRSRPLCSSTASRKPRAIRTKAAAIASGGADGTPRHNSTHATSRTTATASICSTAVCDRRRRPTSGWAAPSSASAAAQSHPARPSTLHLAARLPSRGWQGDRMAKLHADQASRPTRGEGTRHPGGRARPSPASPEPIAMAGLHGVVEADFFDRPAAIRHGRRVLAGIARRLSTFRLERRRARRPQRAYESVIAWVQAANSDGRAAARRASPGRPMCWSGCGPAPR